MRKAVVRQTVAVIPGRGTNSLSCIWIVGAGIVFGTMKKKKIVPAFAVSFERPCVATSVSIAESMVTSRRLTEGLMIDLVRMSNTG